MNDIYAFANLHTDLHDDHILQLAHRLLDNGIDVYDLDLDEEAEIAEEIEEQERGSIRENTQIYMRDVGDYDLLTREQEVAYAQNMNAAMRNAQAAIAPLRPVNERALALFRNHSESTQLNRLLVGFLDPVDNLPEVVQVDPDSEQPTREDHLDNGKASERIKHLNDVSTEYFQTHVDLRTSGQQTALEDAFCDFRFTTNHYTALLDLFADVVKSIDNEIAHAKSVCATAGVSNKTFTDSVLPRLTTYLLSDDRIEFEPEVLSNLRAHAHVFDRVRRALKSIEQRSELSYIEILDRNQRLAQAIRDYRAAKNDLVTGNLRLVMRVAQNYNNQGAFLLDLVQEGNLGLLRAVDRYDYTRGFKFSTYATWWIRQAITQALNEFSRIVKLPTSLTLSIRKVSRARNRLSQIFGRDPTLSELADDVGLSLQQVRDVVQYEHNAISIDEPNSEDDDSTLVESLVSEIVPTPEQIALQEGMRHAVQLTLADLTTRETQILALRYGIGRNSEMSTAEVAQELGISSNRVRQVAMKALRRLRQPRYADLLEPYL